MDTQAVGLRNHWTRRIVRFTTDTPDNGLEECAVPRDGRPQMETRSVSRCVAIAAHGKRCQQSPFRGSPYCWHHTQSRKVWAPSRPLSASATRERAARAAEAAAEAAPKVDLEALAARLAAALGPEKLAEMVAFLESPDDGAYLLVKDEGGLLSEHSRSPRHTRTRRTA
jgi:hypothetical protein